MPSRTASACWESARSVRKRRMVRPMRARLNFYILYRFADLSVKTTTELPFATVISAFSFAGAVSILHSSHPNKGNKTMRSTPLYAPDGLISAGGDPERFAGIRRDYTPNDVARLAGSFRVR